MNPVVGIDVSKGESHGQAFLDRNKPYGTSFRFSHDKAGLDFFLSVVSKLEEVTGYRPAFILEATGHYHLPIIQLAEAFNYVVIILNPLTAQRAKRSHLRKVKTDTADAWHLGDLYYREEFVPYKKRGEQLLSLRHLTRQHESLTAIYVQVKLQFQSVLDQVFPQYLGVFSDLYSDSSLQVLQKYTTPQQVLEASLEDLALVIQKAAGRSHSSNWSEERAKKIKTAAQVSPKWGNAIHSHVVTLRMLIKILLQHKEHLSALEKQIDALASEIDAYELLRSIPGIGDKIAASILSEIGEIERFSHPKKLVAFAGVDPSIFSSGKFVATSNRITKRGSKRLRRALYLAVQCGIRKSTNVQMRQYYDLKRSEGKPYKVTLIACVNKLLHWIYAILHNKVPFKQHILPTN